MRHKVEVIITSVFLSKSPLRNDNDAVGSGINVLINLYLNNEIVVSANAMSGNDGKVIFRYNNTSVSIYVTEVTDVSLESFIWDGVIPDTKYDRQ